MGKKIMRLATTVANQGKPKNIRSIAAMSKSHVRRWLRCTKKPKKTEDHDRVRAHIISVLMF